MRIVIVGASGNVGTALLRQLTSRRGAEPVVGVSRRRPPTEPPYDLAAWHTVDIADPDAEAQLVSILQPGDTVVNLAWGFQPTRDSAQLERVGVGGLRSVLAAVQRTGVGHLVHISSVGAYSRAPVGRRVDESWPTDGVPSSTYSRHKAAAERLLDAFAAGQPAEGGTVITRFRPGLIFQRQGGSSLLRYGVPGYVPAWLIRAVPVLPLDRRLIVPVVHADDVADALLAAIHRRAGGAFNLAAEPPVTRDDIARTLRARPIQVPERVIRAVVAITWHARLQRIDPGWIDLAFAVPLLDTTRARVELGWQPKVDARSALQEGISGMAEAASTESPVLRPRTLVNQAGELLRHGPITRRKIS